MTTAAGGIETVHIGGAEYPLGRIPARRGLTAASLIMPHLHGLRPILEEIARQPKRGNAPARLGVGLLMDAIKSLAPVIEPDTFLEIAAAVTGISSETLGDAPLEDVLAATLKGLGGLDIVAIMRAGMGLFGQARRLSTVASPDGPTEEAET